MSDPDVLECHPTHPAEGRPWWKWRRGRTDPLEPGAAARRLARRSAVGDLVQAAAAIAIVIGVVIFLIDKADDEARSKRIERRADSLAATAEAQSETLAAQSRTLDAQARALELFRLIVVADSPEERAAARAALEAAEIPEPTTSTSSPSSRASRPAAAGTTTSAPTSTSTTSTSTSTMSPPAPTTSTTARPRLLPCSTVFVPIICSEGAP